MKVTVKGQGPVTLTQSHFVATGGQASVYIKDATAYKIYTDPKDAIPEAKFKALAAIQDPAVVRPQSLLLDGHGVAIGYTMDAVTGGYALCQLFTRTFRDKHRVTQDTVVGLTTRLREHVDSVHRANALIVDLNELNVLVSGGLDDTFLIDVDSYQVPGYPATVIMPSVRDHSVSAKDFSEKSDWFSYAVLVFQLFVGAHPYKGTHPPSSQLPKDKVLEHRMRERISAFRADVRLPKCCYSIDSIPQQLRDWLRAVLEDGKREHPPLPGVAPSVAATPLAALVTQQGGKLTIDLIADHSPWTVAQHVESAGHTLTLLRKRDRVQFTLDGVRTLNEFLTHEKTWIVGFTPMLSRPFAMSLMGDQLTFYDLEARTHQVLEFGAEALAESSGRVAIKRGGSVLEVEFSEIRNGTVVHAARQIASVMEKASTLHDGCAIQNMLGSVFVSLFPRAHAGYQVRMPELDGHKIVEAKCDGGVLMVLAAYQGRYYRFVFRFDAEYQTYDVRIAADVQLSSLNFVTLDHGVCVCITEDEKLEAFSARKGSAGIKVVEDPAIGSDLRLMKVRGKAGFERDGKIYVLGLK